MSGSTAPTLLQRLQRWLGFRSADAPVQRPPTRLALLQAAEARTRQLELQLGEVLVLLRSTEERTHTLERRLLGERGLLAAHESLRRVTEERTEKIEHQLAQQHAVMEQQLAAARIVEERTQRLETQQLEVTTAAQDSISLVRVTEERTRTLEHQLQDAVAVARTNDERSRTLESHLHDALGLARIGDERTRTLESQLQDALSLAHTGDERTRTLEQLLQEMAMVMRTAEERTRTLESQLQDAVGLAHTGEERTRTLEHLLQDSTAVTRTAEERTRTLEHLLEDSANLARVMEERSRSQHYELQQARFASDHELDLLHKWYVESPGRPGTLDTLPGVVQARTLRLETEHPLAAGSNDHLAPESTQEGIARPTAFISHCVDVLGAHRALLDLGSGAGGLVYEALMQGMVAIGLDGSDHCRRRRIGYWPLLPDNLRTCDATQPFRFSRADGAPLAFDLVTAWEMLEHIPAEGVPGLLRNVHANLAPGGYFVGSVSLVEYEKDGVTYHVTLQPPQWWRERMEEAGFEWPAEHPFDTRLFYRGNGPRFQDFHNYFSRPDEGFHFVARARAARTE